MKFFPLGEYVSTQLCLEARSMCHICLKLFMRTLESIRKVQQLTLKGGRVELKEGKSIPNS